MATTSAPSSIQAYRVCFPAKQQVFLESFDPGMPGPGEVLVRTQLSLMSTGTENIVFNRLFDEGTHWDRWVKYPFYPGYTTVGVIEAIGEGVEGLQVGQRVAHRAGHRSHARIKATAAYPIPDGLPWDQAVWYSLAKIAFMGARVADHRLGDSVLIIGVGPIGQMSIRWARAAGATGIIVVDTAETRMSLAKAGGATATIVAPITEAREAILKASAGTMPRVTVDKNNSPWSGGETLPRVVIDSTGNATVFNAALGLVRKYGTVILLGDSGQPAKQTLTTDVMSRGLRIIGAHDTHTDEQWNDATIAKLFFDLATSGRFNLEGLTSHVFKPENCAEAYATANRDRAATMGLIFDWTGGK